MTDKKIVIGALSGLQMHARRERVRKTFLPDVARYGMEYKFLCGVGPEVKEPVVEHDLLLLPVPNSYDTLPQRTRAWCKWLLENRNFDLAYKCDDDTCISIPRLFRFAQTIDASFTGVEYHPEAWWHSGGAGFFMDRKAVEIVAEHMTDRTGPEDFLCSLYLNRFGCPTHYMQQTKNQIFGVRRYPTRENDLIVAHASHHETWLTDELWMKIYEETK